MTVIYTLTESDAAAIRARKNDIKAGDSYPAVLVRKFGRGIGRSGNLLVHLNQQAGELLPISPFSNEPADVRWAPRVPRGSGRTPGTWEPLHHRSTARVFCAIVVALLLWVGSICLWLSVRAL